MPKKNKTLCVDDLRHAEYYGMQPVFDELYHRSLEGENFTDLMDLILSRDNILLAYRNIKANGGSYTAGTDNKNISDIGCLPPETVAEKGGLQPMPKRYNTPHRSRVVKTRLSEEEYADFTARLAPYGISQSEFLRQAIRRATIRPVIHVSAVNDELLSAVGKLAAEYGRIGGNLNQIARYLNEYGVPYNALSGEVRAAIADLAALKYEVLKKVGDAVGNTQAYQL